MDDVMMFAFAVVTTPASGEPVYRCALCGIVVMSDRGAINYPYCSDECGVQASAENASDGHA